MQNEASSPPCSQSFLSQVSRAPGSQLGSFPHFIYHGAEPLPLNQRPLLGQLASAEGPWWAGSPAPPLTSCVALAEGPPLCPLSCLSVN